MRALFLTLAALIAAAVAGLLLGPRLVDGELARERLLVRLERATGASARVLGPTEFALFPQPRLTLGRLVLGEEGQGATTLSIERVDLLIGFAGLLGLEASPREARLIRPQLRAEALPDLAALGRLLDALRGESTCPEALSVVGGRVLFRDARLPEPLELAELDLELARETGRGPLVLTGGGRWRDQSFSVAMELRVASVGPHAVRAQLGLGVGPTASRLAYRGGLDVVRSRPRLEGDLEVAADAARLRPLLVALGAERLADRLAPVGSFAARGRLRADDGRIETEGLRIATAGGELAVRFALGLAQPHSLGLEIEASRLELPAGFDPAAYLAAFWAGPPADLAGSLTVRIGTLARAGEALRLVRLDARLPGNGEFHIDTLGAELPGTGDLDVRGTLVPSPAGPRFRGHLEARVEDPRPLLAWLGYPSGWAVERLGAVAIAGDLLAVPEGASLGRAEIRLAGARAQGTFAFLLGPPLRLRLLGEVDRLILDPWLDEASDRPVSGWLAGGPPAGFEAELDLLIERIAWRGLRAERVRIRGELAAGKLRIDELASPALGGGSARLVGSLGPAGAADLALEFDADQPARLVRALGLEPTLAALLEGPLRARARFREDEVGRRLEAELGTAEGGLRLDLELARGSLEPRRLRLAGGFADTAALAARLAGRGALAPRLLGRLDGEVEASRTPEGLRIEGRLAPGRLALEAALELAQAHSVPLVRGRLGLDGADAASLLDLYRLFEAPLGLPPGPLRAWPGAWPRRPFGPPRLPSVDLDLALDLGFVQEDGTPLGRGSTALAFAGPSLAFDAIDLPLAGGRLTGRLLAELGTESGRVEAELRLASAALATLAEAIGASPPAAGTLDLELALASEGRSIGELLGNAGGRGALVLRELALPDPAGGGPSGELLLRGPLLLERGVLRARELEVESAGGPGPATLVFDLAAWILDLELPASGGRVRFLGPPDRLRRYVSETAGRP